VGSAIAGRLVADGVRVVLVGRTLEGLERAVRDRGWPAASIERCAADLANDAEVETLAEKLADLCPDLHILVHAAGTIAQAAVAESDLGDFDRQYRVNLRAPYQLTRQLLPNLAGCGGQVVFVNSSAGLTGRAGVSQYAATKHALRAVADSFREEVNGKGVRVTSVFLGRTASRMQAAVHEQEGRLYRPERLLQPDDVASIVVAALGLPRTAEVTDIHIRPMLKT
jgi:NADP-dependent 3-hydroxy acid dehydrogenase YdfG